MLKVLVSILSTSTIFIIATPAYAVTPAAGTPSPTASTSNSVICNDGKTASTLAQCTQLCSNGKTIPQDQDCATEAGNCSANLQQCDLVNNFINPFIKFLSALVGVAVVASIIIGGIQYSSSGGDPSKANAAKMRIRNAVIALVTFIALDAMLNFLIPGGIL